MYIMQPVVEQLWLGESKSTARNGHMARLSVDCAILSKTTAEHAYQFHDHFNKLQKMDKPSKNDIWRTVIILDEDELMFENTIVLH